MKNLIPYINQVIVFFSAVILLGGASLFFGACAASAEYAPEKMDSPLNQKIRTLDNENSEMPVQFTGKTLDVINEQMKDELQDTGIIIETIAGNIFTANGTTSSIKKVSLLDYVVYLELAKKLDIK